MNEDNIELLAGKIADKLDVRMQAIADKAARSVPKKYFQESCANFFQSQARSLGEDLTGRDLSDIKDKDHIRSVFKHAEGMKEKAGLIGRTAMVEGLKWIMITVALFFGIKN